MTPPSTLRRTAALAIALSLALGCAGPFATNAPPERWSAGDGYRSDRRWAPERSQELMAVLAFSGGGTRAAAFSYGILEELAEISIELEGERRPLLDEVDHISSVSGGSFTAAYYGLFGRRIFDDFEERVLHRDIQGELLWRVFLPWVWIPLLSSEHNRSDLASRIYHETIFEGATFAELRARKGPLVQINATDLASGSPFSFVQEQFDFLCSPLDDLPVATAVAASSAVPGLLSPVPLENYGGECDYARPAWIDEELSGEPSFERRYINARNLASYSRERRSKVRLIDGAMSDNLGVRGPFESTTLRRPTSEAPPEPRGPMRHMLFVLVNATRRPPRCGRPSTRRRASRRSCRAPRAHRSPATTSRRSSCCATRSHSGTRSPRSGPSRCASTSSRWT